jgi:hypothetical protein
MRKPVIGLARTRLLPAVASVLLAALLAAGCGSGGHKAATPATTGVTTTGTTTPSTTQATSTAPNGTRPGALQAEANSAAAGDIPDNQVFLVFTNHAAGYAMKYPEGWAQQGSGRQVTFRDKNNIVRIVVGRGAAPTRASVRDDVAQLAKARVASAPQAMMISGRPAFKVVYSSESAPNAVTAKRVKLIVDRYYLWQGGRRAVVDLGTPQGVDNVDAYRMMIESFRWS